MALDENAEELAGTAQDKIGSPEKPHEVKTEAVGQEFPGDEDDECGSSKKIEEGDGQSGRSADTERLAPADDRRTGEGAEGICAPAEVPPATPGVVPPIGVSGQAEAAAPAGASPSTSFSPPAAALQVPPRGAAASPAKKRAADGALALPKRKLDGVAETVRWGTLAMVRDLFARGLGDASWRSGTTGRNLMFLAAQRADKHAKEAPAIVKFLIEANIPFDQVDNQGQTPLFFAASNGLADVAALLMANAANPDAVDRNKQTPLFYACSNGHAEVLQVLLEKQVSPSHQDVNLQTALFYSVSAKGNPACTRALLGTPSPPTVGAADVRGRTALFVATDLENCKLLLDAGCRVDHRDLNEQTALFHATMTGNHDKARFLLEAKADVNAKDRARRTPIVLAAEKGDQRMCCLLNQEGADLRAADRNGLSPAKVAENARHVHLAQQLRTWEKKRPQSANRDSPRSEGLDSRSSASKRQRLLPTSPRRVSLGGGSADAEDVRKKYVIHFQEHAGPNGDREVPPGTSEYDQMLRGLCQRTPVLNYDWWPPDAPLTQGS